MSIRELKTLVAVAQFGSISAAAERVFLSVPAAAAQIAKLESEFKTTLLNRSRKPAQLTPQGHALVARARDLITQYSQLYDAVSSSEDLTGVLNIGAIPTALSGVIPKALIAFRKAHPRAQIKLEHGLSPSLAERLRHHELDAAIVSEPHFPLPDLQLTPFTREPIVVVAPVSSNQPHDRGLLQAYPYIRFNRHFWVNRIIEEDLQRRRLLTDPIMELDSLEAIGQMVRYGLGVSIIPLSSRSFLRLHKVRAVPFGDPGLTRTVVLAEPIENSKARLTSAFKACLVRAGHRTLLTLPNEPSVEPSE